MSDLDLKMFNSLKKQTKEEEILSEKAPLLIDEKAPKDWYVLPCCYYSLYYIAASNV